MVFVSETTKVYQGDETYIGPWHVYENIFKPSICTVLEVQGYKSLECGPNRTQQQEILERQD